jgi:hypothetical protein
MRERLGHHVGQVRGVHLLRVRIVHHQLRLSAAEAGIAMNTSVTIPMDSPTDDYRPLHDVDYHRIHVRPHIWHRRFELMLRNGSTYVNLPNFDTTSLFVLVLAFVSFIVIGLDRLQNAAWDLPNTGTLLPSAWRWSGCGRRC